MGVGTHSGEQAALVSVQTTIAVSPQDIFLRASLQECVCVCVSMLAHVCTGPCVHMQRGQRLMLGAFLCLSLVYFLRQALSQNTELAVPDRRASEPQGLPVSTTQLRVTGVCEHP